MTSTRAANEGICHGEQHHLDVDTPSDDRHEATPHSDDDATDTTSGPHPVDESVFSFAIEPSPDIRQDIFFMLRDGYMRYASTAPGDSVVAWEVYLRMVHHETRNLLETIEESESEESIIPSNISVLGSEGEAEGEAEGVRFEGDGTQDLALYDEEEVCCVMAIDSNGKGERGADAGNPRYHDSEQRVDDDNTVESLPTSVS